MIWNNFLTSNKKIHIDFHKSQMKMASFKDILLMHGIFYIFNVYSSKGRETILSNSFKTKSLELTSRES